MASRSSARVSRSPSMSRSRSSDKMANDSNNLTAPTFRLVTKSPSPRGTRRSSAINIPSTGIPSRSSSRSRSLRTGHRSSAHIPHSLSGTHLDAGYTPSLGHCLSVPPQDDQVHLVRNFSVTSKGVVNRGDSFRCKSRSSSLCSTPTSPASEGSFPELSTPTTPAGEMDPPVSSAATADSKDLPKHRVWVVGSGGVGKTAIRNQFRTSEYICQDDNWRDERENQSVVVSLDGEEAELEILEFSSVDEKMLRAKESLPDAFLVVFSVANRRSFVEARQTLSRLETNFAQRAAILVANKTDLARLRTVPTVEGRSLAKERGCKFIETSAAINHQLDELLVGVVTQIRIRARVAEKKKKKKNLSSSSKATCVIKRLWRKTCMTSKSCDNLHAL